MPGYGKATLDMLTEILDEGVEHLALLMRHSAREYGAEGHDHENLLTDEGRTLARNFGKALPRTLTLRGYCSPVERCRETAILILDGHQSKGGSVTRTRTIEALGNFYILDMMKLSRVLESCGGIYPLYDSWFAGKSDPDMLIPSQLTAQFLVQVAAEKLNRSVSKPQLDLLVSHDMNLYPVREHLLGQSIAEFGTVEYLDAIAFYTIEGQLMMRSHHSSAIPISIT